MGDIIVLINNIDLAVYLRYKSEITKKKNTDTLLFFFTWEKLITEETFKSVMYGVSL